MNKTTIVIKESVESRMVQDFLLEIKENEKLLEGKNVSDFIRGRAIRRLEVVKSSLEELKKQMADPLRHKLVQEGINPENREDYEKQLQRLNAQERRM